MSNEKLTKEEFLNRAINEHGDYSYEFCEYTGLHHPIIVTCPKHGNFEVKAVAHTKGHGCPICYHNGIRRRHESFLKNCRERHGEFYSYEKTVYKSALEKVTITCPIHGDFEQVARKHTDGSGCRSCANDLFRKTNDSFIFDAQKIHNSFYIYQKTQYQGAAKKITITCPIHGDFEQDANNHLNGAGCWECSWDKRHPTRIKDTKDLLQRVKKLYGDLYDYKFLDYKGPEETIKIICPKHGEFNKLPYRLIKGFGCPNCKKSNGEKLIAELLFKYKVDFLPQHTFEDCVSPLGRKLLFDFYLPWENWVIEYDGKQHYEPIEYFGGQEAFEKTKLHDKIKDDYCKNNKIRMYRISYLEDINDVLWNKILF